MKNRIAKFCLSICLPVLCFVCFFNFSNILFSAQAEADSGGAFVVGASSTFTIDTDKTVSGFSATSKGGAFTVSSGGILNLEGGIVYKNKTTSSSGAGGAIHNLGTVNISDGVISQNTASKGSAIFNTGTINMTGGTISDNNCDNAVVFQQSGNFVMDNGTISQNKYVGSSGVGGCVRIAGGTFTMNNGTISQNQGTVSGVWLDSASFVMNNGTIDALSSQSAVHLSSTSGVFTMNDGFVSSVSGVGTVNLYGGVVKGEVSANVVNMKTASNVLGAIKVGTNSGFMITIEDYDGTLPNFKLAIDSNVSSGAVMTLVGSSVQPDTSKITLTGAYASGYALSTEKNSSGNWTICLEKAKVVVSFNSNGGSSVSSRTLEHGSAVGDLPTATKTGYTLAGWFTELSGGTQISASTTVSANTTFFAHWNPNTYFVSLNANGGTITNLAIASGSEGLSIETTNSKLKATYGKTGKFTVTMTKTGYTFNGWTNSGSGTVSNNVSLPTNTPNTSVLNLTSTANGTVTLTAKWKANSYAISYDTDGGNAISSGSYTFSTSSQTVSLPTPTKTGYTFTGWTIVTNTSGSLSSVSNKTTLTIPANALGAVSLKATWTLTTWTVHFDPCGGSCDEENVSRTHGSAIGSLPTPTRDGYDFVGWFTESDGGTQISETTTITSDVTFYARWSEVLSSYTRVDESGNVDPDGDYILFGSYPKTYQSDTSVITSTQDANGYYLGTDGNRYAKVSANPSGSSYVFNDGTTIVSGTEYYFKVEPIKWRILKTENGKALLLCEEIITAMWFDDSTSYSNNYANSEIRAYLNGYSTTYGSSYLDNGFLQTAFTTAEQNSILTTEVDNSASTTSSSSNTYACENTNDKIFLLSYQDMINTEYGFSSSYSEYDTARRKQTTDYARANYAYYNTSTDYLYNGWYWLRSPSSSKSDSALYVYYDGYSGSSDYVTNSDLGVVPALYISL